MMNNYLSAKTADYNTTELTVVPQTVMSETLDKNQIVHEADDGTIAVVSLSERIKITVTLQWDAIPNSDAETIMDFWADSAKANCRARTFYWQHPTDGNTYTVRFLEPLTKVYTAGRVSHKGISQIKLRVEGVKP